MDDQHWNHCWSETEILGMIFLRSRNGSGCLRPPFSRIKGTRSIRYGIRTVSLHVRIILFKSCTLLYSTLLKSELKTKHYLSFVSIGTWGYYVNTYMAVTILAHMVPVLPVPIWRNALGNLKLPGTPTILKIFTETWYTHWRFPFISSKLSLLLETCI